MSKFAKFLITHNKEQMPTMFASSSKHSLKIPVIYIEHGSHAQINKVVGKKDVFKEEFQANFNEINDLHENLLKHYDFSYKSMEEGNIQYNKKLQRQRKAINSYTNSSRALNTYLHKHGNDPKAEPDHWGVLQLKHVKHLDEMLSSIEAPHDLHVYSGLKHETIDTLLNNNSDIFRHKAYLSSSIDPQVAHNFATPHYHNHALPKDHSFTYPNGEKLQHDDAEIIPLHVLKIHIPQGSKHGAYILSATDNDSFHHEKEFLIGRNKTYMFSRQPKIHYEQPFRNNYPKIIHKNYVWDARIV